MPLAAGRTGEKDLFVFYHHSGGLLPLLGTRAEEGEADDNPALGIYEALVRSDPTDFLYLRLLGDQYTKCGRVEDGLRVDLTLTTLFPEEAACFYNLACSWSLLGELDKALEAMKRAVGLGWRDMEFAASDADLENLRADPRFADLAREVEEQTRDE